MTLRSGLAALAAALLAGAAVLGLAKLRLRGGVPDAQGRGERVLDLEPGGVRVVEIEAGGIRRRLVREGAGWTAGPAAARAEPVDGRVETLLRDVAALTRRATLSDPISDSAALSPYGLDAPRVRLVLEAQGGRVERLALGGSTGEDGAAFAQVTSGRVVAIAASAAAALDADLAALGVAIPGEPSAASPAGEPAPAPVPARTGG